MQIQVAESIDGRWVSREEDVLDFISRPESTKPQLIFISSSGSSDDSDSQLAFNRHFAIPSWLGDVICQRMNGYVAHFQAMDGAKVFFRYQTMRIELSPPDFDDKTGKSGRDYLVDKSTYFVRSRDKKSPVIICFDVPPPVISKILAQNCPPYAYMGPELAGMLIYNIIRSVVQWYDQCVWTLQEAVKDVEMARSRNPDEEPDFKSIHELASCAIQMSEVVEVAIDTTSELMHHMNVLAPNINQFTTRRNLPQAEFWLQLLNNVHRRAETIEKRFKNEISLAQMTSYARSHQQ